MIEKIKNILKNNYLDSKKENCYFNIIEKSKNKENILLDLIFLQQIQQNPFKERQYYFKSYDFYIESDENVIVLRYVGKENNEEQIIFEKKQSGIELCKNISTILDTYPNIKNNSNLNIYINKKNIIILDLLVDNIYCYLVEHNYDLYTENIQTYSIKDMKEFDLSEFN